MRGKGRGGAGSNLDVAARERQGPGGVWPLLPGRETPGVSRRTELAAGGRPAAFGGQWVPPSGALPTEMCTCGAERAAPGPPGAVPRVGLRPASLP